MRLDELSRGQVILVGASYRQVADVLTPKDPRAEAVGMVAVGWYVWLEREKVWSGYRLVSAEPVRARAWSVVDDAVRLFPDGLPVSGAL